MVYLFIIWWAGEITVVDSTDKQQLVGPQVKPNGRRHNRSFTWPPTGLNPGFLWYQTKFVPPNHHPWWSFWFSFQVETKSGESKEVLWRFIVWHINLLWGAPKFSFSFSFCDGHHWCEHIEKHIGDLGNMLGINENLMGTH